MKPDSATSEADSRGSPAKPRKLLDQLAVQRGACGVQSPLDRLMPAS